jgi:hypothetical protein
MTDPDTFCARKAADFYITLKTLGVAFADGLVF